MTIWVIAFVIALLVVELCLGLLKGGWVKNEVSSILVNLQDIKKAEHDEEKQRLLIRGGISTLRFSLLFAAFLFLLVVIVFFFPWVFSWEGSQETEYLIAITLIGTIFGISRVWRSSDSSKRQDTKSQGALNDYPLLDRWLHWLALEPQAVRKLSLELESQFALDDTQKGTVGSHAVASDRAVYVCGLARSGTTMLLQFLDQTESFRSLTYRDMPFVLAPNMWRRLNRYFPREAQLKERAHGDAMLVGYDSPESFEEVFWRTFGNSAEAQAESYGSDDISEEALQRFAEYRLLVANPKMDVSAGTGKPKRYLSKNNNNLLRLQSLAANPTSTILLVYRNPVDTARSLYRLHQLFCTTYNDDFTRRYMGWLGHHEFGPNHLPLSFALPRMNRGLKPDQPDYWLDYWNAVYSYVLDHEHVDFHLVNHDQMRESPRQMLDAIFALLGEEADTTQMAAQVRAPGKLPAPPSELSPELLATANSTYNRLTKSKLNVNGPTTRK
jgi:uncharacterized membrane protein YqjE